MTRLCQCPDCSGFGTIEIARDTGTLGTGYFYEELCQTCEGAGEVEDEETTSTVTLDELMRPQGMGDAATPPLCGPDGLSPVARSQAKPAAAIARKAA